MRLKSRELLRKEEVELDTEHNASKQQQRRQDQRDPSNPGTREPEAFVSHSQQRRPNPLVITGGEFIRQA